MSMYWIWSRPWWAAISDSLRVSVHLTGLPSCAATSEREDLLGRHLQLAAEAAAHVGGDDPQLVLRDAR